MKMNVDLMPVYNDAKKFIQENFAETIIYSLLMAVITFGIGMLSLLVIGGGFSAFAIAVSNGSMFGSIITGIILAIILIVVLSVFGLLNITNWYIVVNKINDDKGLIDTISRIISFKNIKVYFFNASLPVALFAIAGFIIVAILFALTYVLGIFAILAYMIGIVVVSIYFSSRIVISIYMEGEDIGENLKLLTTTYSKGAILNAYVIQLAFALILGFISGVLSIIPFLGWAISMIITAICMSGVTYGMINGVKSSFATVDSEGETVMKDETVISDGDLIVKISSNGAEVISMKKDSKEYIWHRDPKFWKRSSPVLFPFVGKLKDDGYEVNGKHYDMSQHGFLRDRKFEIETKTDTSVVYKYTSTLEDYDLYPYDFTVKIMYQLFANELKTTYSVINNTSSEMPFQIGAHPAFNVPSVDCLTAKFEKQNVTKHYFENGLQTETEEISLGEFDLSYALINDNLPCYSNFEDKHLSILKDGEEFLKFEFEDMTHLAIWSPEHKNAKFVCIEPWRGICSRTDQATLDLVDKDAMEVLAAGAKVEYSYSVEVM